jgi:hypothetical protein
MNEPTQLETQLRSWTPRRPSPELRERIFSVEAAPQKSRIPLRSWNWLAPATVCALSLMVVFGGRPHSQFNLGSGDTNLFFASITMNGMTSNDVGSTQADFALSKSDLNLEQNVWRTASFDSTNLAQTRSSMGSLPVGKTNSLTR